jgi:tetratricopeptide (TPR) repeat protein
MTAQIIYVDFRTRADGKTVAELYDEACKLDENRETYLDAERLYRRALAVEPLFTVARCNLGNVLYRTNRMAEAEAEYRRVIKDDPMMPEAHYNIAYILATRGQHREAVTEFLLAIERDREFADAYFNCAMSLLALKDPHTAKWHWEQYIALEPEGAWSAQARRYLAGEHEPKRGRRR